MSAIADCGGSELRHFALVNTLSHFSMMALHGLSETCQPIQVTTHYQLDHPQHSGNIFDKDPKCSTTTKAAMPHTSVR